MRNHFVFPGSGADRVSSSSFVGDREVLRWVAMILVLMTYGVTGVTAQESRFHFDPNGNLSTQGVEPSSPLQILGQPQSRIAVPGESATFTVLTSLTGGVGHRWQFQGADLPGATNESLVLRNVTALQEGEYRVVVSHASGSVTSAPAMLWLDSDADGVADVWEKQFFANLNQNGTADFDGDGVSNRQEWMDGTNPTDRRSAVFTLTVLAEGEGLWETNPQGNRMTNGQEVVLTAVPLGTNRFYGWAGDVVSTNNPLRLTVTNNLTAQAFFRFLPLEIVWTNKAGGDWHVSTNWSPNQVPGALDDVSIPITATIAINQPAECLGLKMGSVSGNPTLTGPGSLTIHGDVEWTFGSMTGTGSTIFDTQATVSLPVVLSLVGRIVENRGRVQLYNKGGLSMTAGAVFTNGAGAVFEVVNENGSLGGGIARGRFQNEGLFVKTSGKGTLTVNSGLVFANAGVVDVQSGLWLNEGELIQDGELRVAAGAGLRVAGGGAGSGAFVLQEGALAEWAGGTFRFRSDSTWSGGGLYRILTRAAVLVDSVLNVDRLEMTGGNLGGDGIIRVLGTMNWVSGTMDGVGKTVIEPGGVMALGPTGFVALNTRTLENAGVIQWTGSTTLGMNFASVITNRAGARFEIQNAATLSSGAGANRFDNAGVVVKSSDLGTTTWNALLNNFGTVELQSGTWLFNGALSNRGSLALSAGTTNLLAGGGSSDGILDVPAGSVLEWTKGSFALNPGAQLKGSGAYRVNGIGATVVGNGDVTVENLDLVNGSSSWGGAGSLAVVRVMNWTAGTMEGPGRTLIGPGANLNLGGGSGISLHRTLENAGTARWDGNGPLILLNGVVTNRPGALFEVLNSASISFGGGSCRFENAGLFRKSLSSGITPIPNGVPFLNSGTVEIQRGKLAANGGFVSVANSVLRFNLAGTEVGNQHGQLQVPGAVTLRGTLSADLAPGYTPVLNDQYVLITTGNGSGNFTEFAFPSSRVTLELSQTPTSVTARVTEVKSDIPVPVLLSPAILGNQLQLRWTAVSNVSYRVEFTPRLEDGFIWTPLPGVSDVLATGTTAELLDLLTVSNRFYRVRVLP